MLSLVPLRRPLFLAIETSCADLKSNIPKVDTYGRIEELCSRGDILPRHSSDFQTEAFWEKAFTGGYLGRKTLLNVVSRASYAMVYEQSVRS